MFGKPRRLGRFVGIPDEIKEFGRRKNGGQHFNHGLLESVTEFSHLMKEANLLLDIFGGHLSSPGAGHEVGQGFFRIDRFVVAVRAVEEDPLV